MNTQLFRTVLITIVIMLVLALLIPAPTSRIACGNSGLNFEGESNMRLSKNYWRNYVDF